MAKRKIIGYGNELDLDGEIRRREEKEEVAPEGTFRKDGSDPDLAELSPEERRRELRRAAKRRYYYKHKRKVLDKYVKWRQSSLKGKYNQIKFCRIATAKANNEKHVGYLSYDEWIRAWTDNAPEIELYNSDGKPSGRFAKPFKLFLEGRGKYQAHLIRIDARRAWTPGNVCIRYQKRYYWTTGYWPSMHKIETKRRGMDSNKVYRISNRKLVEY